MRILIEKKMIGAYLILCYDINDEKAATLMTIEKSNIDEKLKSAPSNTNLLEFTSSSFGEESNKAVLSITERYWMSKTIHDIGSPKQRYMLGNLHMLFSQDLTHANLQFLCTHLSS